MNKQQQAKLETIISKVNSLINDDNLDTNTWSELHNVWTKLDQIKEENINIDEQ